MANNLLITSKDLYDANASTYILGALMKNPLLLEDDKYILSKDDFFQQLHQIIFVAIYNLEKSGSKTLVPSDIDRYLASFEAGYAYYKQNRGFEFVQQCYQNIEDSTLTQFDYYYGRLKKFTVLRQLEAAGYSTKKFYDTNATGINHDEQDRRLDAATIEQIITIVQNQLIDIENKNINKNSNYAQDSSKGLVQLIENLKKSPEIGFPFEGNIYNYAVRGARAGKLYLYSAPSGMGKALPNDTLIPMANGSWKTVGEVQLGDKLIDKNGKPTEVLRIYPQGQKEVYKITFKDGRTVLCNDEHLWTVHQSWSRDRSKLVTLTLREMIDKGLRDSDNCLKYAIPLNKAVEYTIHQELKLNPYVLGLLLGDGLFREQPSNRSLAFSASSEELPKRISDIMGWTYYRNSLNNYTYQFKENGKLIHITEFLDKYDLIELKNLYSQDKFIPEQYLYGTIEERFELLNGLLDTDGSVDPINGRVSYYSISKKMIKQVQQLCWSLGFIATLHEDKRKKYKNSDGICYYLKISGKPKDKVRLFNLSYKKKIILDWFNNGKRKEHNDYLPIISIEDLHKTTNMTCFWVDNEEHLFLMNDFIVTHNTRFMIGNACFMAFPYIMPNGEIMFHGTKDETQLRKILFIATEMQPEELQTIILAYVSGVNESHILTGSYNTGERERIQLAVKIIEKYGSNFMIEYLPDPSIQQIKIKIQKYISQDDIRYVFYDYIFTSPSLLAEFKDSNIREDVALMMLSNTLKEVASSNNIFIQSATQLNDGWSKKTTGERNQNMIRGSKAIADKVDIGVIGVKLGQDEKAEIDKLWTAVRPTIKLPQGITEPNMVIDVYKNRRGEITGYKIFRYFDYGTAHAYDLFITDSDYNLYKLPKELEYPTYTISKEQFLKDNK